MRKKKGNHQRDQCINNIKRRSDRVQTAKELRNSCHEWYISSGMSRMLDPAIESRTEREITLDPEIEEFGDYLGYGLFVFFAILDTLYLGFISLATVVHSCSLQNQRRSTCTICVYCLLVLFPHHLLRNAKHLFLE